MKRIALITSVSLLLVSNMALAGNKRPACHPITGQLTLTIDNNCPILTAPERGYWYPESGFLFELGVPNTCFKGELTGSLAGLEIVGVSYSAMTMNNFPTIDNNMAFSAVSLIDISTKEGWPLGQVITKDTGIQENTTFIANEILNVTNGSRYFKEASGTINIDGPSLLRAAEVTGTVCLSR
jgi:hypothetical protein